jgi:hypothetical protein
MKISIILFFILTAAIFAVLGAWGYSTYFDKGEKNTSSPVAENIKKDKVSDLEQIVPTAKPTKKAETVKATVTGKLCYPSSQIPEGIILAKNIDTKEVIKKDFAGTPPEKPQYSLSLEAGTYVFAYDVEGKGEYLGYYTKCAKTTHVDNCSTKEDHELIEVVLSEGKTIENIDLCDYYYELEHEPDF